ncbi:MAG TPA: hypothetical protein VKB57_11900, partial [Acidimicrobiales bacterium]|nr:hypothetical protein [Acidimicrobiales bacterium]
MSPRRRPRPPEQAPEHDPGPPAGRRAPRPQDNELHYGEANRRRASEFAAEGNGRRTRRPPAPPRWSDYEPEASTVELAVHQDVFGLAVESPGVTQQPLAPWMTGEHRAIEVDAPPPVDAPGPPPDPGYPEPAPGRSVFDTPAPPGAYDEPDAYAEPPQAAPNGYAHPPQAAP